MTFSWWLLGALGLLLLYNISREIEKLHKTLKDSREELFSKLDTLAEYIDACHGQLRKLERTELSEP